MSQILITAERARAIATLARQHADEREKLIERQFRESAELWGIGDEVAAGLKSCTEDGK